MIANKENIESLLTALNEAIEDKDIVLINLIIFQLGKRYSKDCNSIILFNQNKNQDKDLFSKTIIPIKKDEEKKPISQANIISKNHNNIFSDRDVNPKLTETIQSKQYNNQTNQPMNYNTQKKFNNSNYNYNQNEYQPQYSNNNNNVFAGSNNSYPYNQQTNFQPQYNSNNTNNNPNRGNTNFTNTNLIQENVFQNSNEQYYDNNQNTQNMGYKFDGNKPKTNLYQNNNNKLKHTDLNINNQFDNKKVNYTQLNNINNYSNQFIQERNTENNRRMNSCPDNLNEIGDDSLYYINDYESFCNIMGCNNQKDHILISCESFHEFGCSKCLSNYYKKKYPKLKEILVDPFICPICKNESKVESSHEVLKNVFGIEMFRKLQSN